jgi:hypothetical protein
MILIGFCKEVFPRNIYLGCYVFDNCDSYSWLGSDVNQAIQFVLSRILVLVLLPMLDEYSNGYVRTYSLGTVAKIKSMEEPSLVFICLWFSTHVLFMRLPSKKYKIVPWKKNDFEDLDDLLVYFRFCFIIAESSYVFTMYYLLFLIKRIY